MVEALSDDLNTPAALARLQAIDDPAVVKASASLLGLLSSSADEWFRGGADEAAVEARIAERAAAKKARDFAPQTGSATSSRRTASSWRTGRAALFGAGNEPSALHDRNPEAGGVAAGAWRELEREDGRAELESPTCGSRITIAVELDEERRVGGSRSASMPALSGRHPPALVQQHAIGRAHDEVSDALVDDQPLARRRSRTRPATGRARGARAGAPA